MKTQGNRNLPEHNDPGASVGCYIEQGFPADAICPALNGRLTEMALDEAPASASITQFSLAGTPASKQGGSGPIPRANRAPGRRPGQVWRGQGGLEITAVRCCGWCLGDRMPRRADQVVQGA
jgi:hypothetical protein